jgi:uncharacterized protein YceK
MKNIILLILILSLIGCSSIQKEVVLNESGQLTGFNSSSNTLFSSPEKSKVTIINTPYGEIIITDLSMENYKEKEFICTKIDCGNENIDELVE